MNIRSLENLIGSVTPKLRKSQKKSLAACAMGLIRRPTGKLSDMARSMPGAMQYRDRLKRLLRFLKNPRVHTEEQAPWILDWLLRWQGSLMPVVILMDWTKEHGMSVLVLSLKWQKRSVPFYWYALPEGHVSRSQNSIEYTALRLLKSWLAGKEVIVSIVADRGFSRRRFYECCEKLHFDWIVRVPKSTHILSDIYNGALGNMRLRMDRVLDLPHARLGKDAKLPMRMVCKKSKIKGKITRWYLATSLDSNRFSRQDVITLYARRMGIEATFKDLKSMLGWGKQTRIQEGDRLSRYLLILVIVMIAATLTSSRKIAHHLKRKVAPCKAWRETNPVSFVQLGLWLIQNLNHQSTMLYPRKSALCLS